MLILQYKEGQLPGFIESSFTRCDLYENVIDSSGNIYIVGYEDAGLGPSAPSESAILLKINQSGTVVWKRTIGGPSTSNFSHTRAYSVALDSSENVYACGQWQVNAQGKWAWLAKWNSSGAIQWQRQFGNTTATQDFSFRDMDINSSGTIIVCGSYEDGVSQKTGIAKYNASGVLQTQFTVNDGTSALGAAIDDSGNYFISAWGGNDLLMYFNNSDVLQWQKSVPVNGSYVREALMDSSGNIYIAGGSVDDDIVVAKFDTSGNQIWQREVGIASDWDDTLSAFVDSNDNIYACGRSKDPYDAMYVVKYNSSGVIQKQFRVGYVDDSGTTANGVATFGSDIYLSGWTTGSTSFLYGLVVKIPEALSAAYSVNGIVGQAGLVYRMEPVSYPDTVGSMVINTASAPTILFDSHTEMAGGMTEEAFTGTFENEGNW